MPAWVSSGAQPVVFIIYSVSEWHRIEGLD
jgi:hypothetical protein